VDYFPLNINGGQRNGYQYILIPITEIFVHILMWSLIFEEGKEVSLLFPPTTMIYRIAYFQSLVYPTLERRKK